MSVGRIVVYEDRRELSFSFEQMLAYHGGGSPGGVAHAFKVLERGLPLLEARGGVERRDVLIETAFGGPGARDAFELVTRAVTGGRFIVDSGLARADGGRTRERFVFRLGYRDRTATLMLRAGFVTEEFIELTGRQSRSAVEERRLCEMKTEMSAGVMSAAAVEVYDVVPIGG
jgi:hypothetical protein